MAFRLIYTFLKHFKKVGKGHVIITSGVMGTKTRENSGGEIKPKELLNISHTLQPKDIAKAVVDI